MAQSSVRLDFVRPYLPPLVLDWGARTPDVRHRTVEGSLAFLDVSGFTKLSERLARRGRVGAEDLAEIIDGCFTQLLGVAYGNDASLLKFGGDALLLFFAGTDHRARACRAAVGMRRILREIGGVDVPGGRVLLRMSAGIHSGEFHFFLVGDSHRELVVTGPAATATVAMEAAAGAGEIVVSATTGAHLPERVLGAPRGDGVLLRASPPGFSRHKPGNEPRIDPDVAVQCVPSGLRDYVLAGVHDPEHRQVTVAFVHFAELDALLTTAGPEAAAAALEALVGRVQKAAVRHGVTFLGTDVAADGGKIILVAGAPTAIDRADERMLLTVRQIADAPDLLPLQIGVTHGPVFAGDIGPPYRQTYTIMGDAVNLAARLMAKAEQGEIYASPRVLEASGTQFETTALEPFMVKGKAQPVQAVAVGAPCGTRAAVAQQRLPLVGREEELATLIGALEAAKGGTGRVVEVVAEPGVGKSRLLAEVRDRAEGMTILKTSCTPYESSTPYFPFRALMRGLLGADAGVEDADVARLLEAAVGEAAPELRPWLPLLAAVAGVSVAPTPETDQLGEEFRRPRLHAVVVELLSALLPAGMMLTIEGAHWMDEASADLLGHLAAAAVERPWLVCVSRRDTDTGFVAPELPHGERLELRSLNAEEAAALLAAATADTPLAAHQAAALIERCGGNPLFLQELVAAGVTGDGAELPSSVEGLLGARIDALPPDDRTLLRRLSVLGLRGSPELLPAVLEDVPADDDLVWERVGGLLQRDGTGTFRFPHSLVRDVAYQGLPYRLRQTLHAQVGEQIEQAADDPTDEAELLSFHFFQAHRYDKAWTYSRLAGDRARALYANVDAARFYERALDAAKRLEHIDPHYVASVWETLGDVWQPAGDYSSAARAYSSARRFVDANSVAEARLLLKLGVVQGWLSRYSQARRWIRRGLRVLEGIDTTEAAKQRAQLSAWYGQFCVEGGQYVTAIKWCQRARVQATEVGEREALAHAYKVLDWAHANLGQSSRATYSARALAIYEEIDDLAGQGVVLNNMAIFVYQEGRWQEAIDILKRAHDISRRIGDENGVAFAKYNMGQLLCDQGKLSEAESLTTDALLSWQAAAYRSGVATAKRNCARVAARLGRHEDALGLFEEARTEFEDIGARTDVIDTLASTAECHLLRGDGRAAYALAEETLEQALTMGGVSEYLPILHRVRGYALLQLEDFSSARMALDESLEAGRLRQDDYQVALALRGLVDLAAHEGAAVRADLEEESRAILQRLGVVSPPDPPANLFALQLQTGEQQEPLLT